MRAKEFDARFMDRVRKLFEDSGTLVTPNPTKWTSIIVSPEYYHHQLPFTVRETELRSNLFEYVFTGEKWNNTIQIELTPVGVVNLAGSYYDRRVYDMDFTGDDDAFDADMLTAKLLL